MDVIDGLAAVLAGVKHEPVAIVGEAPFGRQFPSHENHPPDQVRVGPGPGVRGGEVVAVGDINKLCRTRRSITGAYLSGKDEIEIPTKRRPVTGRPSRGKKKQSRPKGARKPRNRS